MNEGLSRCKRDALPTELTTLHTKKPLFITINYERQTKFLGMKGYKWNSFHTYGIPGLFNWCLVVCIPDAYLANYFLPTLLPWLLKIFKSKLIQLWSRTKFGKLANLGNLLIYPASGFGVLLIVFHRYPIKIW